MGSNFNSDRNNCDSFKLQSAVYFLNLPGQNIYELIKYIAKNRCQLNR
jgi:hypothetical protein